MSNNGLRPLSIAERDVYPAQVVGSPDVFNSPNFVIVRPRWIPDEDVATCCLCFSKFNQIRRKHHCRQCGRVLCNSCCKDKIELPHLGVKEKERVCDWCFPVAESVVKSISTLSLERKAGARQLSMYCADDEYISRVIQIGGIQSLIRLSQDTCFETMSLAIDGIQRLSTNPGLHETLVESGAIKAVCSILSQCQSHEDSKIQMDGITTLMVFCKSPKFRSKALAQDVLDIIISLCSAQTPAVSVVAVKTLSLIVANIDTHSIIFDSQKKILSKIFTLSVAEDELMQEVALRILVKLSSGSDKHKHRIVQDDFSAGRCLHIVLNSRPKNVQILCNAASVVANLAKSADDQGGLQELMMNLCHLLGDDICANESDLLFEISKGIANFAGFPENGSKLIHSIPQLMEKCVKSDRSDIRNNGMRAIFHLMNITEISGTVIDMITEPHTLLKCLGGERCLLEAVVERLDLLSPDDSFD